MSYLPDLSILPTPYQVSSVLLMRKLKLRKWLEVTELQLAEVGPTCTLATSPSPPPPTFSLVHAIWQACWPPGSLGSLPGTLLLQICSCSRAWNAPLSCTLEACGSGGPHRSLLKRRSSLMTPCQLSLHPLTCSSVAFNTIQLYIIHLLVQPSVCSVRVQGLWQVLCLLLTTVSPTPGILLGDVVDGQFLIRKLIK